MSEKNSSYVHAAELAADPQEAPAVRSRAGYEAAKRFQDVVLSGAALLVLSPVFLLTSLAIVIDDPHGGPIFSQERVGKDGKPFRIYKFRSMYMDAEERKKDLMEDNEMDGPVFKIKDDPRITRVGKFIRKVSIDELPQLLNIIKGDMSIVGPRPGLPCEAEHYTSYERQRLLVKPGLTCYWQIRPRRNEVSFHEWMELDVRYIRDRSFLKDWELIFKTFAVLIGGQGE